MGHKRPFSLMLPECLLPGVKRPFATQLAERSMGQYLLETWESRLQIILDRLGVGFRYAE